MKKPRVLLTGSAGGVGSMLRAGLGDRWDVVCFDRVPTPGVPGACVADLTDGEALLRAARGCDAILHLGGIPTPADFRRVILPANVIGAWRMYEAAVAAGVRRVVFASTVQVDFGTRAPVITAAMPPRPTNVYGASKAFGEALGRVYAARNGISVLALRLGHVAVPDRVPGLLRWGGFPSRITLTANDACAILIRAVEAPIEGFHVVPAYSRNALSIRDLSPLKAVLGYEPVEDAFQLWTPRRVPLPLRPVGWLRRARFRWRRLGLAPWRGEMLRSIRKHRPVNRVLVTGAAGCVGTALRDALADKFEFVAFDRRPVPDDPRAIVADLRDRAALARAARGCDAIVHLGGVRDDADFMAELLPHNIEGTWNVYEAAAREGVRRVVFASTLQAEEGASRDRLASVEDPPEPRNHYAAVKILGEDLGRAVAARTSVNVVALRLGWVRVPEDPEWIAMAGRRPPLITLTVPDLARIVEAALTRPVDRFALVPAYSRSAAIRKDLAPLRDLLGVEPLDDPVAEWDAAHAPKAERPLQ
jgi:uronate dehydrogenase